MHYKSKQFFLGVIKLIIVIGAFAFIYFKLFNSASLSWADFKNTVQQSEVFNPFSILILLTFTLINWCLEIFKWKVLVDAIKPISFFESFKQCTSSLATSLITPNRIGEYGAKALYYKSSHRKTILGLNLLGNTSQLVVTLFFGTFGLYFLIKNYGYVFQFTKIQILGVFGIIILLVVLALWLFKRKKTILKRHLFNKTLVLKTVLISVLRYVIFSTQFYILLWFFNLKIDYFTALAFISSMYFIASIIPAISLFDVVIKSSVAISVFSLLNFEALPILSISLVMWLLNFALPAIMGCYFVFTYKLNSVET